MARVTVEDCVQLVPNRFKLVMLASQRARELSVGAPLTIDRDNDKNPVVALREIADQTVSLDELETSLIAGLQKHVEAEESEEELEAQLAAEGALIAAGGDQVAELGATEEDTEEGEVFDLPEEAPELGMEPAADED